MKSIAENIAQLRQIIPPSVKLIAVSKTKTAEEILQAYHAGQRAFGENYVQEYCGKAELLPRDIEWHFIGHLQSNKVKYIAPSVHWIHAVDSMKLLREVQKEASKNKRIINVLLQVHIAREESKFGFAPDELNNFAQSLNSSEFPNVRICGLMGMASFTEEMDQVREEFRTLHRLFKQLKETVFRQSADFTELSMGMSGDWPAAVEEGSTMVRIGSAIFGHR